MVIILVENNYLRCMSEIVKINPLQQEIRQAAEFLELPKLIYLLSNLKSDNTALSEETSLHYSAVRMSFYRLIKEILTFLHLVRSKCVRKNLERFCIKNGLFGDITFELDDGQMRAHR